MTLASLTGYNRISVQAFEKTVLPMNVAVDMTAAVCRPVDTAGTW